MPLRNILDDDNFLVVPRMVKSPEERFVLKDAQRLAKLLARITYKKGWYFQAIEFLEYNTVSLFIQHQAVNSLRLDAHLHHAFEDAHRETEYKFYSDDRIVNRYPGPERVQRQEKMPHGLDDEAMELWVMNCIIEMETHEAMEFFKVDGAIPFFPHLEDPPYVNYHPVRREVPFTPKERY